MNYRNRETWLDLPGFEGLYQVSDEGRVRSMERTVMRSNGAPQRIKARQVKTRKGRDGYMRTSLCKQGKVFHFTVHRMVMSAFVGARPDGQHIAHRDGVRHNNRLSNLRYATPVENAADKYVCPHCGVDIREGRG